MTAVVSHLDRPRTSGAGPHVSDWDDMAYSAVRFSADLLEADKNGGTGEPAVHSTAWGCAGGEVDEPEATGLHHDDGPIDVGYRGDDFCFDDFLDFDHDQQQIGTSGEQVPDMPGSLFFDGPALDGSASTASPSDDLDDLWSCPSSQNQYQNQHQQQNDLYHHQQHEHEQQSLVEDTTSSATGGPAARAAAGGFPSPKRWLARTQSSSAIGRAGEQKEASTYPDRLLGPGGSEAISDSELLRLEGISLQASPSRGPHLGSVSQSRSPTPQLHHQHGQAPVVSAPAAVVAASAATTSAPPPPAAAVVPPPNASTRRPHSNFFKAVASKIQKATTARSKSASPHKQSHHLHHPPTSSDMSSVAIDRPISPASSPSKSFKLRPEQLRLDQQMGMANARLPMSPPNSATIPQGMSAHFGNDMLEDPFGGVPVGQVPGAMFRRQTPHTPLDTPVLDDDKHNMYFHQAPMDSHNQAAVAQQSKSAWSSPQPDSNGPIAWANSFAQPDGTLDGAHWWDSTMDLNTANSHFQAQNARNASFNLAVHTQHVDGGAMSYDYHNSNDHQQQHHHHHHHPHHSHQPHHMHAAAASHDMSGLVIGIPPQGAHHARSSSSPAIQPGAYTPLPQQHNHMPQHHLAGSQTERRPRMPRAPSAGARHLQTPMRRQRPSSASRGRARDSSSASPTPQAGSRQSSGSSLGGGPVMGASIKKRRSLNSMGGGATRASHTRTPSSGSNSGLGLGIELGGGGGGGFVNFTPSDKNVLMTGVAPSGSSKTKARREKEAQEKRRRMSEAALRAVREAGGDIDKLMEQGFTL